MRQIIGLTVQNCVTTVVVASHGDNISHDGTLWSSIKQFFISNKKKYITNRYERLLRSIEETERLTWHGPNPDYDSHFLRPADTSFFLFRLWPHPSAVARIGSSLLHGRISWNIRQETQLQTHCPSNFNMSLLAQFTDSFMLQNYIRDVGTDVKWFHLIIYYITTYNRLSPQKVPCH